MADAWEYIKVNVGFDFGKMDVEGDIISPGAFGGKKKIKIAPNQPINTQIFEEAIVLEENGALTKEGMKEYQGGWVSESVYKPLIDFLNR